jgi:hypothetical protein
MMSARQTARVGEAEEPDILATRVGDLSGKMD